MCRSLGLLPFATFLAATILSLGPAPAGAQEAETRSVDLADGWNLVGLTGPTMSLDDAFAGIVGEAEAAAAFDAASQTFDAWRAAGPSFLNTLTELRQGAGIWILVAAATTWEQPIVADPGPIDLQTGFNLLTWTGPSGLDPARAFALLAEGLSAAFAFDPEAARFSSYGPTRPAFVNDLAPLTYGDGFWALLGAARSWAQPAAPGPFSRSLADGAIRLSIPRGALPANVSAESIQVADLTQTPAFAAIAEQAEDVVVGLDLQPSGVQFAVPVTVTATVPNPRDSGLFAFLSSGDEVDLITDLQLVGASAETVTVVAAIDHFSSYWIVNGPRLVTAENQDVGDVPVGTRFDAEIEVTVDADFDGVVTGIRDDPIGLLLGPRERRIAVDRDGSWFLFGDVSSFRPLEGAVARVGPERMIPAGGAEAFLPIAVRQTFSCDGPGDFVILFINQASVPVEVGRFGPQGRQSVLVPDVDAFVRGTCTALPGTLSFQTFDNSGNLDQLVGSIPLSQSFELILHDDANPLPPRFPLTITIRTTSRGVEPVVRTVVFEGDPAVVCSDPNEPNWCSLPIDAIPGAERVEITVTDKDGNPFAFAARGFFDPLGP